MRGLIEGRLKNIYFKIQSGRLLKIGLDDLLKMVEEAIQDINVKVDLIENKYTHTEIKICEILRLYFDKIGYIRKNGTSFL